MALPLWLFGEGQQMPQSVTLDDGRQMSASAFMETFAPSVAMETAAGPGASGNTPGSGAGEYADDAGSLVDGVDRLGSLGRLGDFGGETGAPELPVSGTVFTAQANPAGPSLPGGGQLDPGPAGQAGDFLMTGSMYLPPLMTDNEIIQCSLGIAPMSAPGLPYISVPVMAAEFPFAAMIDTSAGSGWEQFESSGIFTLKTASGGTFVLNTETGYLAYYPGAEKVDDWNYKANSADPLSENGYYYDSFTYIGPDGEEKTVGVLFDTNKDGKQNYPDELQKLLDSDETSHAGGILPGWPADQGLESSHGDGERIPIELGHAVLIDEILRNGGFEEYLDRVGNDSNGEFAYDFATFWGGDNLENYDIKGTDGDDAFGKLGEEAYDGTYLNNVGIDFGDGNDTVNAAQVYDSSISMGDGDDTLNVHHIGNSSVHMGNGDDALEAASSASSTIDMGDGNDRVVIKGDVWDSAISMGDGNDVLHMELDGNGWFASIPAGVALDGGANTELDFANGMVGDILSFGPGITSAGYVDNILDFFDNFTNSDFCNTVSGFEALRIDLTNGESDTLDVDALLAKVLGMQEGGAEDQFSSLIITCDDLDQFNYSGALNGGGKTTVQGMGDTEFYHYEYTYGGNTVNLYVEVEIQQAFGG